MDMHKSSSHIQIQAEEMMFSKIEHLFEIKFEKNKKIYLADNTYTYIQPDFYSEEFSIVGEIFAQIGKPKKAQDNKISNDILKMLLLDKISGKQYRKIIAVCDKKEMKKLMGQSVLAESLKQFGVEVILVELDEDMRTKILKAQEIQRMTNIL